MNELTGHTGQGGLRDSFINFFPRSFKNYYKNEGVPPSNPKHKDVNSK